MAVNRFSRPEQAAKFDPTGLDNLLKVRHLQQAREDVTLNETREWLKDMYNTTHTTSDSEKVNNTRQQYEQELESLADEVRTKGISRGVTTKLLNFKDKYDKEMSASGVLGGAQQFKVMEEQEKARFYDFGLKQGYSKGRIDDLWSDRTGGRSAFDEDGIVKRDYEGVALASKIDPVALFDAKKLGFTKGPDGLYDVQSNRSQITAAITGIYDLFATPGTEEHRSMLDQGMTLEDIKEQLMLAGKSKLEEGVDNTKQFQYEMKLMDQEFRANLEKYKASQKDKKVIEPEEPQADAFLQGPTKQYVPEDMKNIPEDIEGIREGRNKFYDSVYTINVPFGVGTVTLGTGELVDPEGLREYDARTAKLIDNYYKTHNKERKDEFRKKYSDPENPEVDTFWDIVDSVVPLWGDISEEVPEELYVVGMEAFPTDSREDIEERAKTYVEDRRRMTNEALNYYNDDAKNNERTITYVSTNVPAQADSKEKVAIERATGAAKLILDDEENYSIVQAMVGDEEANPMEINTIKEYLKTGNRDKLRVVGVSATEDYPPNIRYVYTDPTLKKGVIIDVEVSSPLTNGEDNQYTAAGEAFSELAKIGTEGEALFENANNHQRYKNYTPIYGNRVDNYSNSGQLSPFIKDPSIRSIIGGAGKAELYKDSSDGKFRMSYKPEGAVLDVNSIMTWEKIFNKKFDADLTEADVEDLSNTNPILVKQAIARLAITDPDVRFIYEMAGGDINLTANVLQDRGLLASKLSKLRQDPGAISAESKAEYMKMLEGRY